MDTFMDKLAQKLTAQEMIRANSAAEAEELRKAQSKVQEYENCLNSMVQMTAANAEALDKLEKVLSLGMDKFQQVELNNDEVKQALKDQNEQYTDFVHKENVKVYRNVQAALTEELEKQNAVLIEEMKRKTKRLNGVIAISIIALVLSAASVAFQALVYFGIL